jgi:DMSO/TMAO reductase YedYZ heme-binding membrane subunit
MAPGTHAKAVGTAPRTGRIWILGLLSGPEAPYLVLGFVALLVLVIAGVTHFRRARRL